MAREQPGFWVVCQGSPEDGHEPLAVSVPHCGGALAVFGFEGEADLYLLMSGAVADGSRAWPIGRDALAALLRGPWARFKRVVLDPMPERDAGLMLRLASVRRNDFVGFLTSHAGTTEGVPAGSARRPVPR